MPSLLAQQLRKTLNSPYSDNAYSNNDAFSYAMLSYLAQIETQCDYSYKHHIEQLISANRAGHTALSLSAESRAALEQYHSIQHTSTLNPHHDKPLTCYQLPAHNGRNTSSPKQALWRLMLTKHFNYACIMRERLQHFSQATPIATASSKNPDHGHTLPTTLPTTLSTAQKSAVTKALTHRLLILNGGAGTGKTTTLAHIIQQMLHIKKDTTNRTEATKRLTIQLTAPTGKASAKLHETLYQQLSHSNTDDLTSVAIHSQTIHRLLQYNAHSHCFHYHAGNPLIGDVFIIDEASMIDTDLFYHLLIAIPNHATLIIAGDPNQLPAVSLGQFFADICQTKPSPELAFLHNNRVELTDNFRFSPDSGIYQLSQQLRSIAAQATNKNAEHPLTNTDTAATIAPHFFTDNTHHDLRYTDPTATNEHTDTTLTSCENPETVQSLYHEASDLYRHYFECINAWSSTHSGTRSNTHSDTQTKELHTIFAAFNRQRILCANHLGVLGVEAFNAAVEAKHCRTFNGASQTCYAGRAIIITQNDYHNQLFNGDIGICLPIHASSSGFSSTNPNDYTVFFPALTHSDTAFSSLPFNRLPAHKTCFAMTIHKSQGSEMDTVWLALPSTSTSTPSPMLNHKLFYTGISRAKKHLHLIASPATIRLCLNTPLHRTSLFSA